MVNSRTPSSFFSFGCPRTCSYIYSPSGLPWMSLMATSLFTHDKSRRVFFSAFAVFLSASSPESARNVSDVRVVRLRPNIVQPEAANPAVRLLNERPKIDDGLTRAFLLRVDDSRKEH